MCKDTIIKQMNEFGEKRIPFFFIIDFLMQKPLVFNLNEALQLPVLFDFNGFTNCKESFHASKNILFSKSPIGFADYKIVFDKVKSELLYGNSYLLNLTFETPIRMNYTQKELFLCSQAKYKMLWEDQFVVFSPESFVKINKDGVISAFPMKGTIDASFENAESILKSDAKEFAEHCTIVDLIRNDLSMVAKNVKVNLVFKANIRQKFAIIDQKIVWYGSINLLSFGVSEESIMRLVSSNIAYELAESISYEEFSKKQST